MSDAAAPGPFPGGHLFPHEELRAPTTRPLSVYVHIPFCAVRCGYCDFNTYTPSQLAGMNMDDYLAAVHAEIAAAARALGTGRAVSTVFFGGG
ncbi:coproporphyrinogen III oxidase, partial [Propionibacterium freudenreichii]|nr:coproporphyrinogen III oxidase [Propionibacterium freudenreichii]